MNDTAPRRRIMLYSIAFTFLFLAVFIHAQNKAPKVRIALFNIRELSTEKLSNVDENGHGMDQQLQAAAQIIQRIKPDILVINEIDHDYHSLDRGLKFNAYRFMKGYLSSGES